MLRKPWILVCVALLPACSEGLPVAPPRDVDAPLQTDALEYAATWTETGMLEASVSFVFTNPLDHAVYLPKCGSPPSVLEKWDDGEWKVAFAGAYPACLEIPILRVEAGETLRGESSVFAARRGSNVEPQFERGMEPPGTYRIALVRVHTSCTVDHCDPESRLPTDRMVSNVFALR